MSHRLARIVVLVSSAAVLVVEITAGRLMAPYVGVSLETFTGIIGVVLAGIATGAAVGGRLADQHPPERLLGPSLVAGGALTWLAVPIVQVLGPQLGAGIPAILMLATLGFFLPSVALSAATPIVVKLRLASLAETGSVVGGLSAAGTLGGLAGTFLTGFVLVSVLGTRATMFLVGALAVAGGVALHLALTRRPPTAAASVLVLAAGLTVFGFEPACDVETRYSCAVIEVDEDDPSIVSLYLDGSHHARVDVDDPTNIELRYIRVFAAAAASLPAGPLDTLHLGGGGFTLPTHVDAVRPGSTNHVVEIDPGVVDIARDHLGLVTDEDYTVEVADARTAIAALPEDAYDLVIGDAFSGQSVPWHLTTVEVAERIRALLHEDGTYVANVIDGGSNRFARAEIATLRTVFEHVVVLLADGEAPRVPRNQIIVASDVPIPTITVDPDDAVVLTDAELDAYVDGAGILTDDFAPVDQLVTN